MGTLWVPKFIAPWVWRVVHVDSGNGVLDLRKDDRVNLVSWAGKEDIVDEGLAERTDV
jgi:hypothetical protein